MNAPTDDLSTEEIVYYCRHELYQYRECGAGTGRYGLVLFQRAIQQCDQVAWASICELYSPLVRSWVERFLSGIRLDGQEVESLVNVSFARFATAFTPEKLGQSDSVAAILSYLKCCSRTVVSSELRCYQVRRRESSLDAMDLTTCTGAVLDDPAIEIVESISAQGLWQVIQEELPSEDERILFYLTCICEMKPSEISNQYRQRFPVVSDVYRLKQVIRERLARSRRIQAFLAPARSDVSEGKEETCDRLIAAQPVALPLSVRAESTQAVPQRTGQDEMGNAVKYYQQIAFCGKARCRQCREGRGHGPYWYAYYSEHGKTIQTYIGRELLESQVQPFAQRRPEKEIKYHLQKTFCGKKNCRRCREGRGHGPYWFAYRFVDGQTKRTYVGKSLPSGITIEESIIDNDREAELSQVNSSHSEVEGVCP